MTFKKALQKLGIEKYSQRIYHSNSHGELFHLQQYFVLAETLEDTSWFAGWFEEIVKMAEANWNRPESVFQHIGRILQEHIDMETNTD